MMARLLFAFAALLAAGCGGGLDLEPQPFTRERADGKIPVKTELIRQQVRAELAGMPEGEAEVRRWQAIEADYHACRLAAKGETAKAEEVFANCMASRGYVYMHRFDAEQLHNDIAFEMEKDPDKWQGEVVTATIAASPITIINAPPPVIDAPSEGGSYTKWLLGIGAAAGIGVAIAAGGGGSGGGGGDNNPTPAPVPQPTMTMIMTMTPPPPTTPTRYEVTSPELGAWHIEQNRNHVFQHPNGTFSTVNGSWLIIIPVPEQGLNYSGGGHHVNIQRQQVTRVQWNGRSDWPAFINHSRWHALPEDRRHDIYYWPSASVLVTGNGQLGFSEFAPLDGVRRWETLLATRPDITGLAQLCPARWLGEYINANHPPNDIGERIMCSYPRGTSYSPEMRQVIYAAMADGFNRGLSIGESGFAFSGRYDGNNRAVGFTYDLGGYAFRTDYIRLPSKQDSAVWLDAYRFGALTRVNDEVQFFAGGDSYRNAIFAIDAKGDRMHRLGFAVGDGYAVKYEYRLDF